MPNKLPYPPPPEYGWYADDEVAATDQLIPQPARSVNSTSTEPTTAAYTGAVSTDTPTAYGSTSTSETPVLAQSPSIIVDDSYEPHPDEPLEYTASVGAQGSDEWDGTVLSTSFMKQEPRATYRMSNTITGQTIVIDMGVLMGRRPSQDIPEGAKSVRLIDPTRTVSRNHAAISFDQDGSLWIEDYGSLNGTFLIEDGVEIPVQKGLPVELHAPLSIRIGDQIFEFDREQ